MILRLLINALAVYISAWLLSGVSVDGYLYAIGVAFLLAVVNILVRPILLILTIPITVVTFGLFILVINTLMILLVDALIVGFTVSGFGWAFVFAIILALVNSFLFTVLGLDKNKNGGNRKS